MACAKRRSRRRDRLEYKKWRRVFGRAWPAPATAVTKAFVEAAGHHARDTEQFIEDRFPVDIRYHIRLDCTVEQKGFRPQRLRDMLASRTFLRVQRDLTFEVVDSTVPDGYTLYWKVLNRGAEAVRRDCVRGKIVIDAGQHSKSESSNFKGEHVVECYAVLNGVVVATDRIHVPIQE